MTHRPTSRIAWALIGATAAFVLAIVAAIGIAYSGAYDIAASSGHTAGVRWLLDTGMQRGVRSRADDDDVRERLARADIDAGAGEYKAMCEHCHGGPGVDPAAWSRGMLPKPPHLVDAARHWEPQEIVWIVRHGIKYTGMPAFGRHHDERTLWNIAAFVSRLPAMTPDAYAAFPAAGHHAGARPAPPDGARAGASDGDGGHPHGDR